MSIRVEDYDTLEEAVNQVDRDDRLTTIVGRGTYIVTDLLKIPSTI